MKIKTRLVSLLLLLAAIAGNAYAQEFATVSPESLDLTLDLSETTVEQVSVTFHPFCVRPYNLDVVASDPAALVVNQTGIVINGCGGDTSNFNIAITGTGAAQSFDLQFIDTDFGGLLASIPVTISPTTPQSCLVDLSLRMRNGTLVMNLGLGTLQPATFNLFLSAYSQTYPLLQAPAALPIIDPPQNLVVPIPQFPDLGTVGILATITTGEDGIRCSAWETIDSGG